MSNHYHVILHVDTDIAQNWDQTEVIKRWRKFFGGGVLIERYLGGQCKTGAELDQVTETAEIWRARLMDISWFMRCLNESIARQANKEDNCKGRFWEGRFKSQALLDEGALLGCMVYVDLNTVHAGICDTLKASDFTSIQQRLQEYQEKAAGNQTFPCSKTGAVENNRETSENIQLNAFTGGFNTQQGLPFDEQDYFELTDWTGRAVHPKKKGFIPNGLPSLLTRLGMSKENWIEAVVGYEKHFSDYVGQEARIRKAGASRDMRWLRGLRA
jgi:putative transposase